MDNACQFKTECNETVTATYNFVFHVAGSCDLDSEYNTVCCMLWWNCIPVQISVRDHPSSCWIFLQEQQLLHSSSHLFHCFGGVVKRRSHRLDARLGGGRRPSNARGALSVYDQCSYSLQRDTYPKTPYTGPVGRTLSASSRVSLLESFNAVQSTHTTACLPIPCTGPEHDQTFKASSNAPDCYS